MPLKYPMVCKSKVRKESSHSNTRKPVTVVVPVSEFPKVARISIAILFKGISPVLNIKLLNVGHNGF